MLQRLVNLGALFLILFTLAFSNEKSQKQKFVICRPVNVGNPQHEEKDRWLIALIDRQVRFRLAPIFAIGVIPNDDMSEALPQLNNYAAGLKDDDFIASAEKLGATHLLLQKFELLPHEKSLNYYIEIMECGTRRIVTQTEKDIPDDHLSMGIDSCLLSLLPQFGVELSTDAVRFLSVPIAGTSLRSVKELGELFCKEADSTVRRPDIGSEYEKLIQKDPFMLLANHAAGMLYFTDKNYVKSAKYIKELLDITPLYTSLYLTLARSYRLDGKFNEALAVALLCERNRLRSVPYLLEKAYALEALKQNSAAFATHQQILMLHPAHPASLLFMARLRNDERNYAEGKTFADKILKNNRNSTEGYFEMGRSLLGLNKPAEAKRAFAFANQLQPDNPFTQEYLGDLCMIHNLADSAEWYYRKSLDKRPLELDLFLKTSNALEAAGKKREALDLLYSIAGRFPSKPTLRRQIGLLEYGNNSLDSAARSLAMYLATKPDDSHVLLIAGNTFLQLKNYRKAKDCFEKALPLTADKISCKLSLAEVELQEKNLPAAKKLLQGIIAEKPVKNAHYLLGKVLLEGKFIQEALKEFKVERELHGNNVDLQEKIARLHFDLAFFAPAKSEYENLLSIAPKHVPAHYYLALLALQSNNTKTGEQYYDKAQTLGACPPEMYYRVGKLLAGNRSYTRAIDAFVKCSTQEPNHEAALAELSNAHLATGNDTTAAAINIRLFRINPNAHSARLAQAGHLYLKSTQETAAASAYQLFLDKGYTDFSVNAAYAGILYRQGDFARVITLLGKMQGDFARDKDNLLRLSHAYCGTEQYAKALPWLAKLRQITIELPLEARLSAQASEHTGDTMGAISMYGRLLSFPSDSFHTEEAYHLGMLYEKKGMTENAIARYELNLKESPDDLRSHERLGGIFIGRKDWQNARRVLETAVNFPHVGAVVMKMLAQTYAADGNMDGAAELYKRYLARVKDDVAAWKELTDIYYSQGKYKESVEPLKQITVLQPDNFKAWLKLGTAFIATENFTAAIAPLGKARSLNQKDTSSLELLARCYRKQGETSTLKSLLREWITLDPRRYDIKMEIGSILIKEKEIDEAITMLTDAIRFIPSESKPHLLLAQAYELKSDDSLRLVHLLNARKFNPEDWESQYELARYYVAKSMDTEAEPCFQKAIDLFSTNAKIHFEYGQFLLAKNDIAGAGIEFRVANEFDTGKAHYTVLLAYTECIAGNRATAMELAKIAKQKAPDDPQILYWTGRIYKETGRTDLASETFSAALAKDSSCAPCFEALGDLAMEAIQFKVAAKHYLRSWERGGYNAKRVYKLGNALFYDGKFVEAKDFFETILVKNTTFDDARYRLTAAYCKLGDLSKARAQIPLFTGNRSPWMQLAQGMVFEHEKNYESALAAYSIARRIAPEHPEVSAGLGRVFGKQQQLDSAIMYLSTASAADTLNMQAMIDLGGIFEASGDISSAVQYYIEVDKKYPAFPEVQVRIAKIKSAQKAHETALRHLLRGLEFHPEDTTLHYMLGEEYTFTNQYKEAIESFKKALKFGKGKPVDALRQIGDVYYTHLSDPKKARDYYKKYAKAGGGQKDALARLAEE